MRRLSLCLILLLALAAAMPARAAEPSGPAWWRISDTRSVLWILGTPDGMMMNAAWSDASLRRRLASAQRLWLPMLGDAIENPPEAERCGAGPYSSFTRGMNCAHQIPRNSTDTDPLSPELNRYTRAQGPTGFAESPFENRYGDHGDSVELHRYRDYDLSARLDAATMARVRRQLARTRPAFAALLLNERMDQLAMWLDLWNWPRGMLGNPVTRRAMDIARDRKLPMEQIAVRGTWRPAPIDAFTAPEGLFGAHWASFQLYERGQYNVRTPPSETAMRRCLDQALTLAETGAAQDRQAGIAAWARGDVANALKRAGPVQLCLMGDQPSSGARAFLEHQAALYQLSLDKAFGGDLTNTVAIVAFDPLLLPGGVLDHYRRLGYDISQVNGMGD